MVERQETVEESSPSKEQIDISEMLNPYEDTSDQMIEDTIKNKLSSQESLSDSAKKRESEEQKDLMDFNQIDHV